ncbi:hypothetical protein CJD36_003430 [Flavipsychrobacter stenotrophus]|uniref:Uncharacterized protein n=1 Tax=Flavipsychrobacter stenotrophus TaxID=2077091 RepID=A0A2S7T0T2_9BACT|nr:hypothetical protein [Flavipsychrobacter stenotrophus]PQJ12809.1 hypothetical protein CJD36_003430 [Flavipsychrobacter stenotrophus]
MENVVYVLLRGHVGYNTFEGIYKDFDVAKKMKTDEHVIWSNKIDSEQVINDTIYVAQAWDVAAHIHIYSGIFYSYEKPKDWLGEKSMILQYKLTQME